MVDKGSAMRNSPGCLFRFYLEIESHEVAQAVIELVL